MQVMSRCQKCNHTQVNEVLTPEELLEIGCGYCEEVGTLVGEDFGKDVPLKVKRPDGKQNPKGDERK